MKASEILELVRAGYTKEEISAMAGDEAAAPAGVQEEQPATDVQEEQPADAAQEPSAQEPSQIEQLVKAFGMKLDRLTKSIQSSNIRSVEGSTPQANDVDTIIARIINPHYGEKEG